MLSPSRPGTRYCGEASRVCLRILERRQPHDGLDVKTTRMRPLTSVSHMMGSNVKTASMMPLVGRPYETLILARPGSPSFSSIASTAKRCAPGVHVERCLEHGMLIDAAKRSMEDRESIVVRPTSTTKIEDDVLVLGE